MLGVSSRDVGVIPLCALPVPSLSLLMSPKQPTQHPQTEQPVQGELHNSSADSLLLGSAVTAAVRAQMLGAVALARAAMLARTPEEQRMHDEHFSARLFAGVHRD